MESKAVLRNEIHLMTDKVKNAKVLQMVRNLLDFELKEELLSVDIPQELKEELDNRRKDLKAGKAKAYSIEESFQRARSFKK